MPDKSLAIKKMRAAMLWQKHLIALENKDEKKAKEYLELINKDKL